MKSRYHSGLALSMKPDFGHLGGGGGGYLRYRHNPKKGVLRTGTTRKETGFKEVILHGMGSWELIYQLQFVFLVNMINCWSYGVLKKKEERMQPEGG